MTVKIHIASSSLLASTIYLTTSSLSMSISALFSGILIDLDHFIDFFLFSKERFSIRTLFQWCHERWEKSIFLFHGYEFLIILALIVHLFPSPLLTGIFLGMGLHLILDQIGNRYMLKNSSIRSPFYFFTYRLLKGFRKDLILEEKVNGRRLK